MDLLCKIPILGNLSWCNRGNHWHAFIELLSTQILATLPIWGAALVLSALDKESTSGIFKLYLLKVELSVSNGELYLYAMSALGPIVYIALNDKNRPRDFPGKLPHIILVLLLMIASIIVFMLQRTGSPINPNFLLKFPFIIYIGSVSLLYLALVYQNNIVDAPGLMRKKTKDFSEEFSTHRDRDIN